MKSPTALRSLVALISHYPEGTLFDMMFSNTGVIGVSREVLLQSFKTWTSREASRVIIGLTNGNFIWKGYPVTNSEVNN